jgi:hypothetical protein
MRALGLSANAVAEAIGVPGGISREGATFPPIRPFASAAISASIRGFGRTFRPRTIFRAAPSANHYSRVRSRADAPA